MLVSIKAHGTNRLVVVIPTIGCFRAILTLFHLFIAAALYDWFIGYKHYNRSWTLKIVLRAIIISNNFKHSRPIDSKVAVHHCSHDDNDNTEQSDNRKWYCCSPRCD